MPAPVTSDLIWKEIEKRLFAVLAFVTSKGEARTAGIVYVVRGRKLYIATDRSSWKARHIAANPHVSVTVNIPKRIPFWPWVKIPDATITFRGEARILGFAEADPEIVHALTRGLELEEAAREEFCVIVVEPRGDFITYGIGVSMVTMMKPEKARGRASI